jgi:signal transduction histidine kinase
MTGRQDPSSAGRIATTAARLRPSSFRSKIVLSTVVLLAVVMIIVGIGVQVFLAFTARRDVDNVLQGRADAVVSLVRGASTDQITVPKDSLDPGVRVYDEQGHLVAGSIELRAQDPADDLARTRTTSTDNVGESLRLLAVPFTTAAGDQGVVVVSQDVTPYERSEQYTMIVTVVLGLLLIGGGAAIARRVTSQALAPVTQMAARASDWSEHDLSHRFDLGPPDNELAALGETLDGLLDRVAMAIRSEQRLTSELAHELRTPLTAIQGSAEVALLRGAADPATRADLEQIVASTQEMSEVISTLLELAREEPNAGQGATCRVADLVESARTVVRPRLDFVDRTGSSRARIAAPVALATRALAPLVDNAVQHARSTITLTATDTAEGVSISVADDGPGLDDATRDQLFDPGFSGSGGTGLGLGIARRVARSLGGDIVLGSQSGGASLTLRLPRV